MSQNQKVYLVIAIAAFMASLGIAFYINSQKNQLAAAKANVEGQLEKSKFAGVKKDEEIQSLNNAIQTVTADKNKLDQQMQLAMKKIEDLGAKIKELGDEKDKWQKRAEDAKQEQDSLNSRIGELNKQIENYKTQEEELAKQKEEMEKPGASKMAKSAADDSIVSSGDVQWAGVLKDKAGLEVQLDDLKTQLSQASQELIDVRQKNDELQISLDSLTEQKASVDREIKYKTDLVNNLSLDLARAKNDQRMKEERIKELNDENEQLRGKIKQLVSSNGSMEKSMVRLNQDKREIEKQLNSTEDLVHSKINEIWDIKSSIDQTMANTGKNRGGDVQLPPITVNNQSSDSSASDSAGFSGTIVSINLDNNFFIVNIGQRNGLKVGDGLGIYRGTQYIGRASVIQVRDDIAAADIKEQSTPVQVGDAVR